MKLIVYFFFHFFLHKVHISIHVIDLVINTLIFTIDFVECLFHVFQSDHVTFDATHTSLRGIKFFIKFLFILSNCHISFSHWCFWGWCGLGWGQILSFLDWWCKTVESGLILGCCRSCLPGRICLATVLGYAVDFLGPEILFTRFGHSIVSCCQQFR